MEYYRIVLALLLITMGLSALAGRVRIPYPILMVLSGAVIGFMPGVPRIQLNPEAVFLIFLPPLLYDAAFNLRFAEARTHVSTITSLAFALVFLTAGVIAVLAWWLIPGMSWPLAFVLGSALAATDAVSAMSITQGLGLPHRITTILEGESLINDASGLIVYRLAVAAVGGASIVYWKAGLEFVWLVVGGFAVGSALAHGLVFGLRRLKANPVVCNSLMLLAPFAVYLWAEGLHVSGVIAVVMYGLVVARHAPEHLGKPTMDQAKSVWDTVVFILNGLIFVIIGLELPYVLDRLQPGELGPLLGYSLLICLVALAVRVVRLYLQKFSLQRGFDMERLLELQNPLVQRTPRITAEALLDWKDCLIISWSGMRGIVSLAAALALPATLADGTAFPMRDTIIALTVLTVLVTLLLQGLTLPFLVKKLNTAN